jgi:hypothetical protein
MDAPGGSPGHRTGNHVEWCQKKQTGKAAPRNRSGCAEKLWTHDPDRNSKLAYYMRQVLGLMIPDGIYRRRMKAVLDRAGEDPRLRHRLAYYIKREKPFSPGDDLPTIRQFRRAPKKTYFFDLYEYLRVFPETNRLHYVFGDVREVPSCPGFVKSRPIEGDNTNSVLMKMNKVRHFNFVTDPLSFSDKRDLVVWRGKAYREHRRQFLERFYDHPLCDVGQTNTKGDLCVPWQKPRMSVREQLAYKFILSIEGNDVASNLKWIMSSNSLAVMTRPKFETWFMEGRLVPDHHYVLVRDDYADLEEKIRHYSRHPEAALQIIENANAHVAQFLNPLDEDALSLMTLQKYFELSGQPAGL